MSAATLRLWLAAPLQSWGTASRFETRHTDLWPSKSGVIGMLCAALGRSRAEAVDDLAGMRFGVRIERPGTILRDFHTVGVGGSEYGVAVASGGGRRGIVTERFYLQDAAFVAGLESPDRSLLNAAYAAIAQPRWVLSLGRRSCPPAGVVVDESAIFDGELRDALAEPWRPAAAPTVWEPGSMVELRIEDPQGPDEINDQPIGASYRTRVFGVRRTRSEWIRRTEGGD